jgi:hypothetical protein
MSCSIPTRPRESTAMSACQNGPATPCWVTRWVSSRCRVRDDYCGLDHY